MATRNLVGRVIDARQTARNDIHVEAWLDQVGFLEDEADKDMIDPSDKRTTDTDTSGDWSLELWPNDEIYIPGATAAGGTFYHVRIGNQHLRVCVEAGAGDLEIADAIVEVVSPGSLGVFKYEQIDDHLANTLLQDGVHIEWTYDDANGTLTPNRVWTRTVTVDPTADRGDYQTVKEACDYVATQSPSSGAPWLIEVSHGIFNEADFSVPTMTTLRGMGPRPTFNANNTSAIGRSGTWTGGTFLTMGVGSRIENIAIDLNLDATATEDGIVVGGNTGRLTNCLVNCNNLSATWRGFCINGIEMAAFSSWIQCEGTGDATGIKSTKLNVEHSRVNTDGVVTSSVGIESVDGISTAAFTQVRGATAWDTDIVVTAGTLRHLYVNFATNSGAGTLTDIS